MKSEGTARGCTKAAVENLGENSSFCSNLSRHPMAAGQREFYTCKS